MKAEVNAKKETLGAQAALDLARTVNQIYVAKGKQLVPLNMRKDKPDDDTLKQLLLAPTGNLRAPTLRKGKTLVVGFHDETYRQTFG